MMFAVGWGANQFAPMLVVYRARLGFSAGTLDLLFGLYALGLIPGLIVGGRLSDRLGRRPLVLLFAALSPLASLLLIVGRDQLVAIAIARLIAGACSGVVFGTASAWLQELSLGAPPGVAARRAAVAMSAGFGSGALVTGLLGQWGPATLWFPYVPHVILGLVALALGLGARETVELPSQEPLLTTPHVVKSWRFAFVIVPLGPWVFGLAVVSGVVLPQLVHGGHASAVAFAGVANALTLFVGTAVQPFARRVEDRRRLAAGLRGLLIGIGGIGVALLSVVLSSQPLIVVAALPLGAAYGLVLVSGLREVERLAPPDERATTIAVYLSLTYLGFGFPYVISALSGAVGARGALLLLAGALALCSASVAIGSRRSAMAPAR